MNKRGFAVLVAAVTISFAGVSASAAWAPMETVKGWCKCTKVNALVVTGNYLRPRCLANLAQENGGQPVLVFARDGKAYLTLDEKTVEVLQMADVAARVQKLAVSKVIVLGDAQYVSQECLAALGSVQPTILADADWSKNGAALAEILKEKKLKAAYEQCLSDIDEVLQRAASKAVSSVAVPAEPTVSAAEPVSPEANQPAVAPAEPEVAPMPVEKPAETPAEPIVIPSPIEPIIKG